MIDYNKLGQKLKNERKKLNVTQEHFAEIMNVSNAYIGQLERGERSPALETLVKLADKLGVTANYLLSDNSNPTDEEIIEEICGVLSKTTTEQKKMILDVIKVLSSYFQKEKAAE